MNDIFKFGSENAATDINSEPDALGLEKMSDDEIKKLIAQCYKLLDRRKREHEKQVKEQIRQMAVQAGIKVSFTEKTTRKTRK